MTSAIFIFLFKKEINHKKLLEEIEATEASTQTTLIADKNSPSPVFNSSTTVMAVTEINKDEKKVKEKSMTRVYHVYKLIWKLICKKPIRKLIFIFLTIRVNFIFILNHNYLL